MTAPPPTEVGGTGLTENLTLEYVSIGQYLASHAAHAPINQQIKFGQQVQRYVRALDLECLRVPGQPLAYPLTALETIHKGQFACWNDPGEANQSDQVATLCAELIGNNPAITETAWMPFDTIEAHCVHHGHFSKLLDQTSVQSRRARLGMLLHRYADTRLSNGLRLHVRKGRTSFFQIIRTLAWKNPSAPLSRP